MPKVKRVVDVSTYPNAVPGECARIWITKSVANALNVKEKEDWIYICKDWMGVLSTQAMLEGILDEEGDKVYLSPDRMRDAHFKEGDKPKIWKLTEWE